MKLYLSIINIVLTLFIVVGVIYCIIKHKDGEYYYYDQTRKKKEKESKKKISKLKRKETIAKNLLEKEKELKDLSTKELKILGRIINTLYNKNYNELYKMLKENPMILHNKNVRSYINNRPDVNEIKVLMKESIDYILNNILSEEEKEELKRFTTPIMVQLPALPEETEEEKEFLNGVVEEIVNNPTIDTPIEMEQVIEEAVNLVVQNIEENEKGTIPIEIIKEQLSEKIEKKVEEKVKQEIKKEEIKEKIEEQLNEQIERKVERKKKSKSPILLYSIIAIIIFIIITLYFIFKK